MRIGIPKEIKDNENRVGMTPAGVSELVRHGHEVYVQHTAGVNSGFTDEMYVEAGASILPSIEETYGLADMIIKVKEPIAPEYALVREGQLVFTYFHFACSRELTEAMVKSGGVCLAYETVQLSDGSLPLLARAPKIARDTGVRATTKNGLNCWKSEGCIFTGSGMPAYSAYAPPQRAAVTTPDMILPFLLSDWKMLNRV